MNIAKLAPAICLMALQSVTAQNLSLPAELPQVQACFLAAQRATTAADQPTWGIHEVCVEALAGQLSERERIATLTNLALIQVQLGDFDEAMNNYDSALASNPPYADVYLNRGNLFYLRREFAAAIRDYSEALRLGYAAAELIHLNRGMAYQSRGDYVLAESDYRAALALLPRWPLPAEKLQMLEIARQSSQAPR